MILVNYIVLDDGSRYVYTIDELDYDYAQLSKRRGTHEQLYSHYLLVGRSKADSRWNN